MSMLKKLLDQDNFLKDYRIVDEQKQKEWDDAFANVRKTLEKEAPAYMTEERTKAAEIAELSRIKMLG
jgi:hypothetical protein